MIRLAPDQVTPAIRGLFDVDMPAGVRCRGVLEGNSPGTVFADDAIHPTWAVVRESAFGTLYPAGAVSKPILAALVDEFQQVGEVLIGFWDGDSLVEALPTPEYDGLVLDFMDRPIGQGLEHLLSPVPEGCVVREMDRNLHQRSPWYDDRLKTHGSLDEILKREIGFCLVRGETLVSEASAGPVATGVLDIGTITHKDFRGRGYATFICAYLIRECEGRGFQTYWNCNKENLASAALARTLGYRSIREYRLFGWFPPGGE